MPAPTRTLPIPAAHREFIVKVGGAEVARSEQLLVANVVKVANRIASARLVYLDGSASSGGFPLSSGTQFVPGSEVEVLAGAGSAPVTLFKGIVVRQSVRVREHTAPQLVVECRHKAAKLTVGRKNACFIDQSDSDIISSILGGAGLSADVATTSAKHRQQVQYRSTDWDYVLARARANGLFVLTNDDGVVAKAPSTSGSPALTLQFGASVLELDAEIDARSQFAGVKSVSWDPAQQSLVEAEAASPSALNPGDLTSDDLSAVVGLPRYELRHTAIGEDEARSWAEAEWLRSKLNKVTGRAKCEGVADVKPGDVVALAGLGGRFNGNALVTAVRHDFDPVQGWKTHVQFGGVDESAAPEPDRSAPAAAGLLPAVSGLQIGVVTSNVDPQGEHRVRVRLPLVSDDDGIWARVASLDAGDGRGFFFRPELGDEVVVGFLDADPRCAVVLGMLHSSAKPPPLDATDDNHEKMYQSRSKMKVSFNDDEKTLELATPAGNSIKLSEKEKSVVIADQNGNRIELSSDGITIESAKALTLKAGTELKLDAGTSLSAKGGSDLKLQGAASAELSSSATTAVKGGLVQIN